MFRQVIAYRWIEGATDEQKDAFRAAFAGLRAIPELTHARFADDGRFFEGNHDAVAVMDFPDFESARRYVVDERHQAYVRDHASTLLAERVVVQHDWAVGDLAGIRQVALPVSDLAASAAWYATAFGFVEVARATGEVTLVHDTSATVLVLRHDPARAAALAGFDVLTLTAGTAGDLDAVVARLDAHGVAHGAPTPSPTGVRVDVADPDGIVVRVSTLLP